MKVRTKFFIVINIRTISYLQIKFHCVHLCLISKLKKNPKMLPCREIYSGNLHFSTKLGQDFQPGIGTSSRSRRTAVRWTAS